MVDPDSDRVSRAPPYSGYCQAVLVFAYVAFTLSDSPSQVILLTSTLYHIAVLQPHSKWFGLLPVRSPLLRESLLISVPGLLRWFTSPSMTPVSYFIQIFRWYTHVYRITPFGNLRFNGYVLLHAAFRSLSRPSSPYSSIGIRHEPIFAWPYYLFHPAVFSFTTRHLLIYVKLMTFTRFLQSVTFTCQSGP